jgi:hypothetical protein
VCVIQVSSDFMSILEGLIPDAFPIQKCDMNISPIFSGYEGMGILNGCLTIHMED